MCLRKLEQEKWNNNVIGDDKKWFFVLFFLHVPSLSGERKFHNSNPFYHQRFLFFFELKYCSIDYWQSHWYIFFFSLPLKFYVVLCFILIVDRSIVVSLLLFHACDVQCIHILLLCVCFVLVFEWIHIHLSWFSFILVSVHFTCLSEIKNYSKNVSHSTFSQWSQLRNVQLNFLFLFIQKGLR